ncbi:MULTISPECIES: acyltransferase [Sphingobacterium]|uniref:acyltransferase n=1 Tax=Sphingobacterium TaxID=28453 RepID=UPI00104EFD57|nr:MULTISPECIES: acyltransferase [Sphingobacterium]MCW2262041.1 acetyltransferase-like isoleucine patch superfamily enzyme [Sphingobacterium kitahiroshimense]NJI75002.1 acyltransferase [Sphingobacterium sp. B16(2022)]TCR13211.1 transferase family hexapeptide repeat protein [Sphingobacterium sp. JUb78]
MKGRDKFKALKPIFTILILFFKILPKVICEIFWSIIMPFNGLLAKGIRYSILKANAKEVGDNLSVGANTIIKNWQNFSCGNNVSIHENCVVDCDGEVKIGNNVSIAHASSLVAANHTWSDYSVPIKYNPLTVIGIIIYDDVWIGCGVRILDGVRIHSRSIIAAGAVVNRIVESNSLVGGVPAKLIKKI